MPTWRKASPKPTGYLCDTFWHLRRSGNLLAIYYLIGRVTKGGSTSFFGTYANVARYFFPNAGNIAGAYEMVRRSFHTLRKLGWLKARPDGHWDFITHEEWEREHTGECFKRVLLPWQTETDPLIKQLYAMSNGKLRLYERHIAAIRKQASDEEIITAFAQKMDEAAARRADGDYAATSPRQVFWQAYRMLRDKRKSETKANT
jgi:hypothetical protein